MNLNNFFKAFLVLCFSMNICAGRIELINKYVVPVPENKIVHSINMICDHGKFIIVYYAAESGYMHGGSAPENQWIWETREIQGSWDNPHVVAKPATGATSKVGCFDPVIFKVGEGPATLFYRCGESPRDWKGYVKFLNPDFSWSEATPLPEGIVGASKCKPLASRDGKDLICGSSFQKLNPLASSNPLVVSNQDGWVSFDTLHNFRNVSNFADTTCWVHGNRLEFKGCGFVVIQPAMWVDVISENKIHALCRTNTGKLAYTCSTDFGKTWEDLQETELPSNYSAIDIIKICIGDRGRVFMVWNPLEKTKVDFEKRVEKRWRLIVSELVDNDNPQKFSSWQEVCELEYDKRDIDESKKAEYSFPSMIVKDGKIFVAYGIKNEPEIDWGKGKVGKRQLVLAELSLTD